jgi:sec-independent protein translocase protein TatA
VPFGIGATELIIVLVIVLIIFGPKKLPQLGRSLGGGLREFKNSVSGKGGDDDDDEPEVIEGPDRSNVTTAAAADDEETETARRQREAKTADAS